jgi:hypothetical protein
MSKQLRFYEPEYFGNANIWNQGGASTRRTVIVPLNRDEFLGYGMLSPLNEVLFVTRGRVDQHQEDFIARMERAGAIVEFRTQRPVKGVVLVGSTPPDICTFKETEGPPPAPNLGEVSIRTDRERETFEIVTLTPTVNLWPQGSTERMVVVSPIPGSTDVIAFGLCEEIGINAEICEVPFVARLPTNDEYEGFTLADFTLRMDCEEATVMQCEPPLQESLKSYMTSTFGCTYMVVADARSGIARNGARYPRAA